MARISGFDEFPDFLMQQVNENTVVLFMEHTEQEVVRFNPRIGREAAEAQQVIREYKGMSPSQKMFAHFWSGYFYAYAIQLPAE